MDRRSRVAGSFESRSSSYGRSRSSRSLGAASSRIPYCEEEPPGVLRRALLGTSRLASFTVAGPAPLFLQGIARRQR